jgi:hypothetical protein
MKPYLILVYCFFSQITVGQIPYNISYSKPTILKINYEYQHGNEKLFDVDFINERNQKVKSIKRTEEEDHSSKTGYQINQSVAYYFYRDDLLVQIIRIDPDHKIIYKIDYSYNENNRPLGWISYSNRPKISRDSFTVIMNQDVFLNNPSVFPTENLTLETKQVKEYDGDNLVYKCYYERYGKLKTAIPAREQFFKYNEKGQLIEHISNPKSDAGGTAFLRTTFVYNGEGQAISAESYSDGYHQCTIEYKYGDTTIEEIGYFLDDKGDKEWHYDMKGNKKFVTYEQIYFRAEDGKFYNKYRTRFSLAGETE